MAGFGPDDVIGDRPSGYRSQLMQPGVKSYNGFNFPPCSHSQITVVPEYDDSGRTTKWLTIALSLEFIVSDPAIEPEDNADLNYTGKNSSMNITVKSLIQRLSQPCQRLVFTAQGFGDFIVNGPLGMQDIDFGPKPQVIEWEFLGGSQAAKVIWLCVTRVPPCLKESTGPVVQLNYNTSWGVDNGGFFGRVIEGSIEFPGNRPYSAGDRHASNILTDTGVNQRVLEKWIDDTFPRKPTYRRNTSFRRSENRKTISFKIEDTEIKSDSMFLPGISDIDITQNISSTLEEAFQGWKITYSGTIEVVRDRSVGGGIPIAKKVAWSWLGKFLQSKRKLFEETIAFAANNKRIPIPPVPADPKANAVDDVMTQQYAWVESETLSGEDTGAFIYPVAISITDSLYSNTISFSITYASNMTSTLIARAVGLFNHVKIDGLKNNTWVEYINAVGADDVESPSQQVMVVDMCHTLDGQPSQPTPVINPKTDKFGDPIMGVSAPKPGKDWEDYQCTFKFIQDHQNVMSTKLYGATTDTQDILTKAMRQDLTKEMENKPYQGNLVEAISGNAAEAAEARIQTKVYSPNPSVCYVEMRGHASRFNGRINPPVLIGVGKGIGISPTTGKGVINNANEGGALAHQYGEDIVIRDLKKTGLKDENGKEVIIHYCSWVRTYVLDRKPDSGKVYTTGLPHRFKQDMS